MGIDYVSLTLCAIDHKPPKESKAYRIAKLLAGPKFAESLTYEAVIPFVEMDRAIPYSGRTAARIAEGLAEGTCEGMGADCWRDRCGDVDKVAREEEV